MVEQAAAPEESKGGGTLKTVLILIIVILLVGIAGGVYFMMPEPIPELATMQWPPEEENAIEVSATLADGTAVLLTSVRFETVPVEVAKFGEAITLEFQQKRNVIESIITEVVADHMTAETVIGTGEFRRLVMRRINDELTQTEIERVLTKDWVVHPTE
jgi:flagellar basal body-associated protein FliL